MKVATSMVARENGQFRLWYVGSRGKVADRVFCLGLATGTDGLHFAKQSANPVFAFPAGDHRSVLTPTMLRQLDGTPIRENGRLRVWFAATDFHDASERHFLHETSSADGIVWSTASGPLLADVYAPSVLRDETGAYRLWYTDVSREPWVIRSARSADGRSWEVAPEAAVVIDQPWEQGRLFFSGNQSKKA